MQFELGRCIGQRYLTFIADAVRNWITAVGAKTAFIDLGSPWENGYCESFNSKLHDGIPNGEVFYTLAKSRVVIEGWRRHYSTRRPHSSFGYKAPAFNAALWPAAPAQPDSPAVSTAPPKPIIH